MAVGNLANVDGARYVGVPMAEQEGDLVNAPFGLLSGCSDPSTLPGSRRASDGHSTCSRSTYAIRRDRRAGCETAIPT
jgi:hypothetical protein